MFSSLINARSVSRPAWNALGDAEFNGEVLAVFRRACIIRARPCSAPDDDEAPVIALVLPEIGAGPLNIVLDGPAAALTGIRPGAGACFQGGSLCIGLLRVLFKQATIWEASPDWDQIRSRHEALTGGLEFVLSLAQRHAPSASMLELLGPAVYGQPPYNECCAAARQGMKALEAGWRGEAGALEVGAAQLAGLGSGLTPAGDDFLAGVMLSLWLRHPAPFVICRSIVQVASPRTTLLSAAMLQRAAAGECSADWQRLLHALVNGDRERTGSATRSVLSHGYTSGGDMLAGFLWMSRLYRETCLAAESSEGGGYCGVSAMTPA